MKGLRPSVSANSPVFPFSVFRFPLWRGVPVRGVVAALILACLTVSAEVRHEEFERDGKKLVALENELYRLVFAPARGGRCSSFVIKANQRELVYDGKNGGFFQDHFAHQGYPGELLKKAYHCELKRDGDRSVSIRLWTEATGAGGRDPLTRGVEVSKTVTLENGDRAVRIENAFHNPTEEGKNVGMWIQQCFCYGGERLYDIYYRPSTHGVHVIGRDDTGHHPIGPVSDAYSADWVGVCKYTQAGGREPIAGWTAGRDRKNNEGGVFLLDYNYLDVLYNCSGSYTTEWWLDPVPLPPGKSWRTQYRFVPVNGFTGFAHASHRIIGNTELEATDTAVTIRHQFAGTTQPLGKLEINTRIYGIRSEKEASLPPITLTGVGLAPTPITQTWSKPQAEPVVARVTAKGEDWEESYEVIYAMASKQRHLAFAARISENLACTASQKSSRLMKG